MLLKSAVTPLSWFFFWQDAIKLHSRKVLNSVQFVVLTKLLFRAKIKKKGKKYTAKYVVKILLLLLLIIIIKKKLKKRP